MTVNKNIDQEQYKQTLASILPTQFEPGSLADRLLIQGREEGERMGLEKGERMGLEKGELVGKVRMLQELLGDTPTPAADLADLKAPVLTSHLVELQQRLRDRQSF